MKPSKQFNQDVRDELAAQFKAIWTLEEIWRRYRRKGVVVIPCGAELEYVDMEQTLPADAVKHLREHFGASYSVVSQWVANINPENALA